MTRNEQQFELFHVHLMLPSVPSKLNLLINLESSTVTVALEKMFISASLNHCILLEDSLGC